MLTINIEKNQITILFQNCFEPVFFQNYQCELLVL